MPMICRRCGEIVPANEKAIRRHDTMCGTTFGPAYKPTEQMSDKQRIEKQRYEQEAKREEPPVKEEFTHLGLAVGRNRAAFAIDGTRIMILATNMEYFETAGDTSARYITFRFIGESIDNLGKKFCITHRAFSKRATLWKEKLPIKYVTLGQLMEANGAPCEAGCRALYWWLMGSNRVDKDRDWLIINIAKHGKDTWNNAIKVQDLYDWYKAKIGPVPYDYLIWIYRAMGGTMIGAHVPGATSPGSKSYALLCRQLGIKP